MILFYPPSDGPFADVSSFETTTTVSIHKDGSFTTVLPRPQSKTTNSITWNGTVQGRKKCGKSESEGEKKKKKAVQYFFCIVHNIKNFIRKKKNIFFNE